MTIPALKIGTKDLFLHIGNRFRRNDDVYPFSKARPECTLVRHVTASHTLSHTCMKALLIFRATLSASVRIFGTHTHTRARGGRALHFRPRDRRKLADYLKERNPEKRKEREKKIPSCQSRESREGPDFVVSPYVKVTRARPSSVNLTVAPRLRE